MKESAGKIEIVLARVAPMQFAQKFSTFFPEEPDFRHVNCSIQLFGERLDVYGEPMSQYLAPGCVIIR